MATTASTLPQMGDTLFLSDGGIETCLVFLDGIDLPYFAAFDLLKSPEGTARLKAYYKPYIAIADEAGTGFILEAPTWRASPDWAAKLGHTPAALAELNRRGMALMAELRDEHESATLPMVISGCVGPRGDGYRPDFLMSAEEARAYHGPQIETYAREGAQMISAITMTYPQEAIGIANAAAQVGLPVAVSFTTETNGLLPGGQTLKAAVEMVDAASDPVPAYYMINCAHPAHFEQALMTGEPWLARVGGIRANASMRSHEELDNSSDLDAGDPDDLARRYAALRRSIPSLNVFGGCCGTDHRHIGAISRACAGR